MPSDQQRSGNEFILQRIPAQPPAKAILRATHHRGGFQGAPDGLPAHGPMDDQASPPLRLPIPPAAINVVADAPTYSGFLDVSSSRPSDGAMCPFISPPRAISEPGAPATGKRSRPYSYLSPALVLVAVTALVWLLLTERTRRRHAETRVAAEVAANATLTAERDVLLRELGTLKASPPDVPLPTAVEPRSVPTAELGSDSVLGRVGHLKRVVALHPQLGLPEFAMLSDEDWLAIARQEPVDGEVEDRIALNLLRQIAKQKLVPELRSAERRWTEANPGQHLTDAGLLKPFLTDPAWRPVLDRYEVWYGVPFGWHSTLPGWYLRERWIVDDWSDTTLHLQIGSTDRGAISGPNIQLNVFSSAHDDFVRRHGRQPAGTGELRPYLKLPIDEATLAAFMDWRSRSRRK